jgi:hypothetical protein
MIEAKPFQRATIVAALRTLTRKSGARRFLVADEVGLGKTIVASGIIEALATKQKKLSRAGPINVLYVCSNQAIAKQNTERLLSFLPKEERKSAVAHVDRPSLLPTRAPPDHELVNVYMLTPDTAIPTRNGQRRDGRKEERALALVLLRRILPLPLTKLYRAFRRSAGTESFSSWVRYYQQLDQQGALGGGEFRNRFKDELRAALGLSAGQHLPPRLSQLLAEKKFQELVGACRTALTVAALQSISADLVIFDEFQRFRDLLEDAPAHNSQGHEDELERARAAARVLEAIRGLPDGSGPALLLLSATPYTPYRARSRQEGRGAKVGDQSSDFFDLVEFLAAKRGPADQAKTLFMELSEEVRKGVINSDRAREVRGALMDILLPLMSRTERPAAGHHGAKNGSIIDAELLPCDIGQFRDMQDSFGKAGEDWIVPLWQSVPLPMQTLGSRYLAWRNKVQMPPGAALTQAGRDAHQVAAAWPHPRLRSLMEKISGKQLGMPWAAPSLPWWPLKGGWKGAADASTIDGKLLVFSRFKAVPTSVAGLISYATESRLLNATRRTADLTYEAASKRKWLQPSGDRPNFLELFHPSPLLAALDPLTAPLGNVPGMRQAVESQLRARLKDLDIKVVTAGKRAPRRKPWELLIALERKAGLWEASRAAWENISPAQNERDSIGGLRAMIEKWDQVAGEDEEITSISRETDLPSLVSLAMESPAVVLLRALGRHWEEAMEAESLPAVTNVAWRGLRSYLDKAWFVAALGDRGKASYPATIRRAVVDGNLESVLDEHFWFLSTDGAGDWLARLEEVEGGLRLRDVSVTFHDANNEIGAAAGDTSSFGVRCHVAVPLAEGRKGGSATDAPNEPKPAAGDAEAAPLRPDEVRKAFNSPFWPNVLVTTSIGQEGLDLHPWCNALAHWDLATSPVALEQREGRITRFASLSVRRAIARQLSDQLGHCGAGSPWVLLASLAEEKLSDPSGMAPWWTVKGGDCRRFFLAVPGGEQQERYETLTRERALYRLVLGMPDQADLVKLIDAQGADPVKLQGSCIDLSAYENRNQGRTR